MARGWIAIGALLACLASGGREACAEEAPAAARPGYAGKDVEWWIGELGSPRTREAALAALRAMGSDALLPLARALRSAAPEVREPLSQALLDAARQRRSEGFEPLVIPLLDDGSAVVRRNVLSALVLGSNESRPAVPRALALVRDPDVEVRRAAVRLVARFPEAAPDPVETLRAALGDADPDVAESAAGALASLGTRADAAVTELVALASHPKVSVRQTALLALERSQSRRPDVLAALLAAARDAQRDVRIQAYAGLGRFAKDSEPALEALGAALDAPFLWERRAALAAIAGAGPAAAPYLPALRRALAGEDRPLWRPALNAIEALGAAGAPAAPDVVRAEVRDGSAGGVLWRLAAIAPDAVLACWDEDPSRREAVLAALRGLDGPSMAARARALVEIAGPVLADPRAPRRTRAAAAQVLWRAAATPEGSADAVRSLLAFVAAAEPSPSDTYGEVWLLWVRPSLEHRIAGDGSERLLLTRVLRMALLSVEIPGDRRQEALRVLVAMARAQEGDALEVLGQVAEAAPEPIRSAATAARASIRAELGR